MVNLSLNELKLIEKNESMSEGKLLSALNASESVKIIREIRKENRDEDKILKDFIFDPQKDHYEPKKLLVLLIITIFNIKVWEIKTKIYQSKNILML